MKVVFTAFNRQLRSNPQELPDDTQPQFYMPMSMDALIFDKESGEEIKDTPTMKKALFRATGRSFDLKSMGYKLRKGEGPFAKEYILVDIS